MSHKLVAFSDSIEKWTNFTINFGFIKGCIGGGLSPPPHVNNNFKVNHFLATLTLDMALPRFGIAFSFLRAYLTEPFNILTVRTIPGEPTAWSPFQQTGVTKLIASQHNTNIKIVFPVMHQFTIL